MPERNQGLKKVDGSGGIRTHASEETGALNQRLRPLGHATLIQTFTSDFHCSATLPFKLSPQTLSLQPSFRLDRYLLSNRTGNNIVKLMLELPLHCSPNDIKIHISRTPLTWVMCIEGAFSDQKETSTNDNNVGVGQL